MPDKKATMLEQIGDLLLQPSATANACLAAVVVGRPRRPAKAHAR